MCVGVGVCVCVLVAQLCPTLCNPVDFGLSGSSVHGILQARILKWVAIPFSIVAYSSYLIHYCWKNGWMNKLSQMIKYTIILEALQVKTPGPFSYLCAEYGSRTSITETYGYWLNENKFEQIRGAIKEQGRLAYCSPWDHKFRHSLATEQRQQWLPERGGGGGITWEIGIDMNTLPWASQVTLVVKNLPANAGNVRDLSLIPGLGRSPGKGNGYPLQYSCLENPMDRRAWQATVHGVTKSWTRLSDLACTHMYYYT